MIQKQLNFDAHEIKTRPVYQPIKQTNFQLTKEVNRMTVNTMSPTKLSEQTLMSNTIYPPSPIKIPKEIRGVTPKNV